MTRKFQTIQNASSNSKDGYLSLFKKLLTDVTLKPNFKL